jgi:gliding motility-associated-like protein
MQRPGLFTTPLVALLMCLWYGKPACAQGFEDDSVFTWKLQEVANPTTRSIIKFIPNRSFNGMSISWKYGTTTVSSTKFSPKDTFDLTVTDSLLVKLLFTRNGVPDSVKRIVPLSPAYFRFYKDTLLDSLASYKYVFRSFYHIPNVQDSLKQMRFRWTVNGTTLTESRYNWPNIYYTFTEGGDIPVTLEVYNASAPNLVESFTQIVHVRPIFGPAKEKLNVSNVFTPNDDGVNDFFEVSTSGTCRIAFKVFSRTGMLVYQQEANILKWDGRNQYNKELPEGVYYYTIEDLDGKYETAKGFVYIFRGK